jgi:aspartyl-tRNA(Asn)/glutamyl-tRNA(Gln) amidotransferase subunit B
MNSFRFLERGIDAEIARQESILRGGGAIEQETLHFDPQTGEISSLRSKEEAHDYRYFPEPDLVPLAPTEAMLARARDALPELPAQRAQRFESELALPAATAKLLAFRSELGDYYEEALAAGDGGVEAAPLANWVTGELLARLGDVEPADSPVGPAAIAKLVAMVSGKQIAGNAAKEVLGVMAEEGGDPEAIAAERSLGMADAGELDAIVDRAIEQNADAVEKVRAGNDKAIGAIMGAVMRETKGRADGGEVQRMIRDRIH